MRDPQRILAVIPARGGSKGLPGKNIALLSGKPLLAHSIEHSLAVKGIDRVVVSTDDDRIAEAAREAGAHVVERPPELASDAAPSEGALLHALDRVVEEDGHEPDLVLFLQATSPIRRPGDIDRAVRTLVEEGADSLFSASPQHGFVWIVRDRAVESLTYDFRSRKRIQDHDGETVVENGSFYLFKPSVLRTFGNRLGGTVTCVRMGFLEALQIDDGADLELAEWLLAAIRLRGWPSEREDNVWHREMTGDAG
jgi:N-acylneuraminate cytidylyltransferase